MKPCVLGIDVGGSGIKAALVDTRTGVLTSERYRIPTPIPSTPRAIAGAMTRVTRHFSWSGPVGCGMPGSIRHGKVVVVNNLDRSWVGVQAHLVFSKATGCPVTVVNDADAAGLAEMRFGAGSGERGVVVVVTLGTGIGSALFVDGRLVPNTELGQIELRGKTAELRASAKIRKERDLSWEKWSRRLEEYFQKLELLFRPDLIVVGGGVSRKAKKFLPRIRVSTRIVPATLMNEAGLVGAALSTRSLRST